MNIKKTIALMGLTVTCIGLIGCSKAKTERTWEVLRESDVDLKANIAGFENENFALSVGYKGEVHYTVDGGKEWPAGENTSLCRFGLDIIDENIAWSCGNAGHVRVTKDGGKTWTDVTDFGPFEPNQCRYISFLDDQTGWIAAPALLGITKDGGTTWNELTLPADIGIIQGISLLNETEGCILDSNNKIYLTKDGGTTWESQSIPCEDADNTLPTVNLKAIRLLDENTATLFYYTTDYQIKCLSTTDRGKTWTKEAVPELDLSKSSFYLSHDGKLLTVLTKGYKKLILLQAQD